MAHCCNELFHDAFVLSCLHILDINNILTIEAALKTNQKAVGYPLTTDATTAPVETSSWQSELALSKMFKRIFI